MAQAVPAASGGTRREVEEVHTEGAAVVGDCREEGVVVRRRLESRIRAFLQLPEAQRYESKECGECGGMGVAHHRG